MENYTYNSYPDSGNSSPRSREIEFENPSPWEDQPQNYKVKFMCSYAGKIHPRPHDNQLAYIGGETKILAVDRNIKFSSMISKLSALCATGDSDVSFKYQLPGEDLDALISVTNDDDLEHMMHEYDRLYRAPAKPARMRLFIFSAGSANTNFGSEGSRSDRERFVDALNSGPSQGAEKTAAGAPQNKVDFLFGLEKGVSPPLPVKTHDPIPEPVAAPPPPPISEAVGPDHVLNAAEIQRQLQELQRLQIRDQEQQAIYRKKSEDNTSVPFTGEYYTQRLPEKSPSVTLPMAGQPPVPAPTGFWSDKQISGGFPAAVTTTPGPPAEHPVYMIHAPAPTPATVYHAAPPAPAPAPQMVRSVHGQASQGYYTNVQRMPAEMYREQPMYNMMAPPMQHPQAVTAPQVGRPGGGVSVTDAGYAHVGGAFDRQQVYYTTPGGMVVPPQYQGVGVAVSGDMRQSAEGKMVPKVSQASV